MRCLVRWNRELGILLLRSANQNCRHLKPHSAARPASQAFAPPASASHFGYLLPSISVATAYPWQPVARQTFTPKTRAFGADVDRHHPVRASIKGDILAGRA